MKIILMILTSGKLMSNNQKTGVWLSEFSEPYELIKASGHYITIASIKGGIVSIDPKIIGENDEEDKFIKVLQSSVKVDDIDTNNFDAVFLPGGHGTMLYLAQSNMLNEKLGEFADQEKVMAAVGLTKVMPFLLEDEFKSRGANYVGNPMWESHVELDGFVVTGQNPQSAIATVNEFIEIL